MATDKSPSPLEVRLDRAEKAIAKYCRDNVPSRLRRHLQHTIRRRGSTITLIEGRPHFADPEVWLKCPLAQFRYDNRKDLWSLLWPDRNGKWYLSSRGHSPHVSSLIREIDLNPPLGPIRR